MLLPAMTGASLFSRLLRRPKASVSSGVKSPCCLLCAARPFAAAPLLALPFTTGGVCTGVEGVSPLERGMPFGPLTEVKPGVGDCVLTAVKPPPTFTGVNPLRGGSGNVGGCGCCGLRPSSEALSAFDACTAGFSCLISRGVPVCGLFAGEGAGDGVKGPPFIISRCC